MKTWKAALGVGAACAVCCAVPLVGGAAALAAGSTALAAVGATLLACVDELLPLGGALLALAVAGGAVVWWRRRAARNAPAPAGCGEVCEVPKKSCGCGPAVPSV